MNWKTFFALLSRDAHVARRNLLPTLLQNLLQPLLFTFVFGKVMTSSGMMPAAYKNMLLPGVMAISMVMAGVQAVAMPLITEFQFTREIEDRLLKHILRRGRADDGPCNGQQPPGVEANGLLKEIVGRLRHGRTWDSEGRNTFKTPKFHANFTTFAGGVIGCHPFTARRIACTTFRPI